MNTQLVQCLCHERIPCTPSWRLVYNPLFGLNFLAVPLSELISDQFAWGMIPTPCGTRVCQKKIPSTLSWIQVYNALLGFTSFVDMSEK